LGVRCVTAQQTPLRTIPALLLITNHKDSHHGTDTSRPFDRNYFSFAWTSLVVRGIPAVGKPIAGDTRDLKVLGVHF
jgi:hypothetical protein